MNYRELEQKIEEIGMSEVADDVWREGQEVKGIPGLKLVYREGGSEGGGEHAERVFQFEDSDLFVRITGYYYSYDGTTWESIEQVTPREKTITVYDKI
jgi:hypothetical protein